MSKKEQPQREVKRTGVLDARRARKWWLLVLALLMVLGAGIAYGWQWYSVGTREAEMLEFMTKFLCAPFAIGLLLLFAYFKPPAKKAGQ